MWHKPLIILALPRGNKAKDTVVFRSLTTAAKSEAIITWVKEQLASRLKVIHSDEELMKFRGDSFDSVVRVLLISHAKDPPLFFSALSMKFAGRVTFAVADAGSLKNYSNGAWSTAAYYVITPEGVMLYGFQYGQNLNYKSMGFFLRTLQPEANDSFILSLILVNFMMCLDFFVLDNKFWKHLVKSCWKVIKYNFLLLIAWLALLGLCRFTFVDVLIKYCLQVVRTLSLNHYISIMMYDLKFWKSCSCGLFGTILMMCFTYAWIKRIWFPNDVSTSNSFIESFYQQRLSSVNSYVMNWFFRPMATLTRPVVIDLDFAEEMELLIRHLATPNIWLQPRFQNREYIDSLPVWRFQANDYVAENQALLETGNLTNEPDTLVENSSEEEAVDGNVVVSSIESGSSSPTTWYHGRCLCRLVMKTLRCRSESLKRFLRIGHQPSVPHSVSHAPNPSVDRLPIDSIPSIDCAICLEHYQDGDLLCGLPCGHSYHQHCILSWLLRDKHHCPTCRWPSYKSRILQPVTD